MPALVRILKVFNSFPKLAILRVVISKRRYMKRILTFGASSSRKSINRQLAQHVASLLSDCEIDLIDLNDFEMPIYSIDREANGIPEPAHRFKKHITEADGIIISFSEHNGTYTTAFKNILDWISRLEGKTWEQKPMLMLSTSPGQNGGATVLGAAVSGLPYLGANVVGSMSVPSFGSVFNDDGIIDMEMNEKLKVFASQLTTALSAPKTQNV